MDEAPKLDGHALLESTMFALGPMMAKPTAEGAHRFRNELSVILGLLDHQRAARRDTIVSASLDWLEERLFTIAAIHELCLAYEGEAGVPFQDLCENLIHRMILAEPGLADRFSFMVRGAEFALSPAVALKLGLAVEELLSNCRAHSHPAAYKGMIRVELMELPEDLLAFRVIDGGSGTVPRPCLGGGGLSLTKRLVEGLGGCFVIDDHAGSEVLVLFERSRILAPPEDRIEGAGMDGRS